MNLRVIVIMYVHVNNVECKYMMYVCWNNLDVYVNNIEGKCHDVCVLEKLFPKRQTVILLRN